MGYKWEKNETNKKVLQKVSTPNSKTIKTPDDLQTDTATLTCSMNDSIVEQSIVMPRLPQPPDGPPPGPSQLQPPAQGPFLQRPLLLHAPHYIFNL